MKVIQSANFFTSFVIGGQQCIPTEEVSVGGIALEEQYRKICFASIKDNRREICGIF